MTVRSSAKVLPLVIPTVTVETFSATAGVASSSSSAIGDGSTDSDRTGTSSPSVTVTGYLSPVVPSGIRICTNSRFRLGEASSFTTRSSEPS